MYVIYMIAYYTKSLLFQSNKPITAALHLRPFQVTPLALRSLAAAAPMLSQTTSLVSTLNLPNSTHSPAQFVPLKSFAATAAATPLDTTIDTPTASIIPLVQYTNQGSGHDIEVPLYNINGEEIGKHVLGGDIFNVPIREDILYRVVRWQLAKKQAGTHKAKTRSEVRGGGRKPWKQKGSGRARAGSIRSPLWRGGGKAHGPVVRSHAHDLPKRVRRLGLKIAVSAKAWERRLKVVDSLRPEDYKTKTMAGHLEKLLEGAPRRSVLFCDSDKEGLDGGYVSLVLHAVFFTFEEEQQLTTLHPFFPIAEKTCVFRPEICHGLILSRR